MDEVAPLPSQRYAAGVACGDWQDDPAQRAVLAEFDRCTPHWRRPGDLPTPASSPPAREAGAPLAVPGCTWGGVGRGKTFLVDLFFAGLPLARKRRVHFHRFMREVHAALRALEGRADPLREVAADIAAQARVLCLDEFFVGDIGDAMILGGLLRHLVARGTSLITTSNTAPPNLYRDGLQRERFLPAIALLQQHCRVVEMVSAQDWRLRTLRRARTTSLHRRRGGTRPGPGLPAHHPRRGSGRGRDPHQRPRHRGEAPGRRRHLVRLRRAV